MLDAKVFFDQVRGSLFRGSLTELQVSGMDAIVNGAPDDATNPMIAYALATAYHETAQHMQPVIETRQPGEASNPSVDTAIARLERAWAAGRMPWVRSAYWRKDARGLSWLGRGLPQMTFEANYVKLGKATGLDLANNPDLALVDEHAVNIMYAGMMHGLFTGKRLGDYFGSGKSDPVGARRIINVQQDAQLIAGYWSKFNHALQLATTSDIAVASVRTTIGVVPAPTPDPGMLAEDPNDSVYGDLAHLPVGKQDPTPPPAPVPAVVVAAATAKPGFWHRLFGA